MNVTFNFDMNTVFIYNLNLTNPISNQRISCDSAVLKDTLYLNTIYNFQQFEDNFKYLVINVS